VFGQPFLDEQCSRLGVLAPCSAHCQAKCMPRLQDCLDKHQRGLLCCRRVGVWPYTIHLSYCHVAIHPPGRAMNALERQQDMIRLGLPWCWCQQKHCLCGSQPVGVLEGFLGKSERLLLQDGRRLRHGRCLQALSRTAGWWLGACIVFAQSALRSGLELPGANSHPQSFPMLHMVRTSLVRCGLPAVWLSSKSPNVCTLVFSSMIITPTCSLGWVFNALTVCEDYTASRDSFQVQWACVPRERYRHPTPLCGKLNGRENSCRGLS